MHADWAIDDHIIVNFNGTRMAYIVQPVWLTKDKEAMTLEQDEPTYGYCIISSGVFSPWIFKFFYSHMPNTQLYKYTLNDDFFIASLQY